ncbi:MAG: hypothetical protein K0M45_02440 [Candidatus Paracaedibacteraceae bacterium]|nr:hypothetical protein [Candidatus Paracaedibacteraceae bacterium]
MTLNGKIKKILTHNKALWFSYSFAWRYCLIHQILVWTHGMFIIEKFFSYTYFSDEFGSMGVFQGVMEFVRPLLEAYVALKWLQKSNVFNKNNIELPLKLKFLLMGVSTVGGIASILGWGALRTLDLQEYSKFCQLMKACILIGGGYLIAKKFDCINRISPFLPIPSLFNQAELTLKIKDIFHVFLHLFCRVYAIAFLSIQFIDSLKVSLLSDSEKFSGWEGLGYMALLLLVFSIYMFFLVYKAIKEAAVYKFDHLELRLGTSKWKKRVVIFLLTSLFFVLEKASLVFKYFFLAYNIIDIQFILGHPGFRLSFTHSVETLICFLACLSIAMVVWYILVRGGAVSVYRDCRTLEGEKVIDNG